MSLDRGIELFNQGHYWEAHEAWEEAWTPDRRGPDSGFYKGLIQVAAGCLHYTRRNRRGTVNKWRSGAGYLRAYPAAHHRVALAALVTRVEAMLAAMEAPVWPELELPRIERAPSRGERYEETYDRRAAAGEDVHGEARFVLTLGPPGTVLDAGCGTGRVARELARRGVDVVGVDIDPEMLEEAVRRAPALQWQRHDVALVDLRRTFDVVLMAGNLMLFVAPGREPAVVANMARHLVPGGLLVAGFAVKPGELTVAAYEEICASAGLEAVERWSTWQRDPFPGPSGFSVSVHRRGGARRSGSPHRWRS
jgi:SAM-dependent methyltransferase